MVKVFRFQVVFYPVQLLLLGTASGSFPPGSYWRARFAMALSVHLVTCPYRLRRFALFYV